MPRLNSVELSGPAAGGVLGEVGPFVQAKQQAPVELEERDGSVGAGDLVVKLLPDDALGRPAQAVAVEGDRPVEVVHGQGDEEDLGVHCVSRRSAGRAVVRPAHNPQSAL